MSESFSRLNSSIPLNKISPRCSTLTHNGVHRGQEQHVGDQGAGREDDWRVQPEEQA